MKIQIKTRSLNRNRRSGFTLIEMIGVLAVIAILAAMLIPKVFEAINNSRINNSAVSCQAVKTALIDHYAKFGSIAVDGSGATPTAITVPAAPTGYPLFDEVLLKEGFMDKPFGVKIGDGTTATTIELIPASSASAIPAAPINDGIFDLSGAGVNSATGLVVVEAVITGVTESDAQALSARMDGPALSVTTAGLADTKGRVKYAAPSSGSTTVYVYLTHR